MMTNLDPKLDLENFKIDLKKDEKGTRNIALISWNNIKIPKDKTTNLNNPSTKRSQY